MANCFTTCCKAVTNFPSRILCLCIHFLQAGILDYYLVTYKSKDWLICIAADAIVGISFVMCFYFSYKHIKHARTSDTDKVTATDSGTLPMSPITWFVYATLLSVKVGICFKDFVHLLDESTFFGSNTLSTDIALGGVIFTLLLSTNHDAKPGSPRRKYVEELTGTVIFDILDCVDSMDILFDKEERDTFPKGMDNAIIAIGLINFFLPTIPLITLSKTKYGQAQLSQKLVMIHKICIAFLVNLPLLVTRMILWHGLKSGVSIFSLKNIIVIGMTSFDLYEIFEGEENEDKVEMKDRGSLEVQTSGNKTNSYALQDSMN